jgi:bifunctional enzyme CysN/CysC
MKKPFNQVFTINRVARENLKSQKGKVIWLTGFSGSGKSTIANALESELYKLGKHTYILDGDNVRLTISKDLGFSKVDRIQNILRVAEVARLMMDAGLIVITALISPFQRERDLARELIGSDNFLEVYVNTPLVVCEERDVKGLYKKARLGLIPNFTGIDSPYEAPVNPDITIKGEEGCLHESLSALLSRIID